ncbi:MAG TPA: hypothetical protein VFW83_10655, partial [Bryobacteraceae bacterium]|nr:hypothetical protein [Bryobacteraceae bacterium]
SRSPLAHFVRSHGAACASPHPLFDCESYLLENPEAGRQNPLLHYVRSERRKNTATAPQAQIRGGRPVHFAPLDVMDVKLIVVFLETHFDAKTAEERNEIRMRLDGSAKRDRLAGTLVPVWKDREGRTRFLAPPQQRPFFQAIRYDQLRVQADRTFLCAFEM